jgi:hypothetical protein
MTKRRFGKRLGFGLAMTLVFAATATGAAVRAQGAEPTEPVKAAKLIKAGDVLSGELNAMKVRSGTKGKRVPAYEVRSEPRRLPTGNGMCGLETGPETFQIIANNPSQVAQLKNYLGKEVSLKVDEIACSEQAGQMSDAVVTKWSVVKKQ